MADRGLSKRQAPNNDLRTTGVSFGSTIAQENIDEPMTAAIFNLKLLQFMIMFPLAIEF